MSISYVVPGLPAQVASLREGNAFSLSAECRLQTMPLCLVKWIEFLQTAKRDLRFFAAESKSPLS